MAAYIASVLFAATASAAALNHGAGGLPRYAPAARDGPFVTIDDVTVRTTVTTTRSHSPAVTAMMQAAQDLPVIWVTVTVTVTTDYPHPGTDIDLRRRTVDRRQESTNTVPGQVVSCGNLLVVHGTHTTDPARAVEHSTVAAPLPPLPEPGHNHDVARSAAINAMCFRRIARRDTTAATAASSHVLCFRSDSSPPGAEVAPRQLTACETSFSLPTPTAEERRRRRDTAAPETEWNLYLPDGRSLREISDKYAGHGVYDFAGEPVESYCYFDWSGDDGSDDKEGWDGSVPVVCAPVAAGGDGAKREVGRLVFD